MDQVNGKLQEGLFEPIVIPTIKHIPWVERNIPIPQEYYEVLKIIKEILKSVSMKRSNLSTKSSVLCPQKDGSPFGSCMTFNL